MTIELALYQPDIPQNFGAAMRLCACVGAALHVIEPCGFPLSEKKIRQSAMDYMSLVNLQRYETWEGFLSAQRAAGKRIILMTTKAAQPYLDFAFQPGDVLLAGRESAGAPDDVHEAADGRVVIPMSGAARSMNIINASSMIMGEALRQVGLGTGLTK